MEHSTEKNQIQGFCEDVMYRLFGMGYLSETYPMSGNSSVSLIGSEEQIIFPSNLSKRLKWLPKAKFMLCCCF